MRWSYSQGALVMGTHGWFSGLSSCSECTLTNKRKPVQCCKASDTLLIWSLCVKQCCIDVIRVMPPGPPRDWVFSDCQCSLLMIAAVIFIPEHRKRRLSYHTPTPALQMLCFVLVLARYCGPSWVIFGAAGFGENERNRGPSSLMDEEHINCEGLRGSL